MCYSAGRPDDHVSVREPREPREPVRCSSRRKRGARRARAVVATSPTRRLRRGARGRRRRVAQRLREEEATARAARRVGAALVLLAGSVPGEPGDAVTATRARAAVRGPAGLDVLAPTASWRTRCAGARARGGRVVREASRGSRSRCRLGRSVTADEALRVGRLGRCGRADGTESPCPIDRSDLAVALGRAFASSAPRRRARAESPRRSGALRRRLLPLLRRRDDRRSRSCTRSRTCRPPAGTSISLGRRARVCVR